MYIACQHLWFCHTKTDSTYPPYLDTLGIIQECKCIADIERRKYPAYEITKAEPKIDPAFVPGILIEVK